MKFRPFFGVALAGLILLGTASQAKAQFGLSMGNPYTGQGLVVGNNPYGYGGYGGYGVPGATRFYNSGYAGYAPAYGVPRAGYGYGYGAVAPRYYAPVNRYMYRGFGGRRFRRW